ncbi:hypothetical protein IP76_04495 [Rhizobium sp. AAP43]|nr:hypothetical protein IP76_04495 [Rhizobium sp. AAP43]
MFMATPPLHVLIAENQYLIAMEVERILRETVHCDVSIVPLSRLGAILEKTRFDIVIVEAAAAATANLERSSIIETAGAVPVFLSSYDELGKEMPAASAQLVVQKPLAQEELATALAEAAARVAARRG